MCVCRVMRKLSHAAGGFAHSTGTAKWCTVPQSFGLNAVAFFTSMRRVVVGTPHICLFVHIPALLIVHFALLSKQK